MVYLAAICLVLVAWSLLREVQWARERRELLQRIQAPEQAVLEHAIAGREPVPQVPYEDDAAFAEARRVAEQRVRSANGTR